MLSVVPSLLTPSPGAKQDRLKCAYLLRCIALCLLALASTHIGLSEVRAQSFTVDLLAPAPYAMHLEAMWRINFNNGGVERQVRLFGIATESRTGRFVAQGLTADFTVKPGFSSLNPDDVSPIDYDGDPGYDEVVQRTGKMPAGEYTICIMAIDAKTNDTIARDCLQQHVVLNVTPSQLLYPRNGSKVKESTPVFTWTPISPATPVVEVTYQINVVEILGRQTPFDAMQSNPRWWEEVDITSTTIPYDIGNTPFEPIASYAWQITAYGRQPGGESVQLSKSEIWSFTIMDLARDNERVSSDSGGKRDEEIDTDEDDPYTMTPGSGGKKEDLQEMDREDPRIAAEVTNEGNKDADNLPGDISVRQSGKCSLLKVGFNHLDGDTLRYAITIKNGLTSGDTVRPMLFRLKVAGDTISQFRGEVAAKLKRTPSKFPPGSASVEWMSVDGLPGGELALGEVLLAGATDLQRTIHYYWIGSNDKIICQDSVILSHEPIYYDLSDDPLSSDLEVLGFDLRVQFVNDYASSEDLQIVILDPETREEIRSKNKSRPKVNLLNGLNRILISLKDYSIIPGKRYSLQVRDPQTSHNLNFITATDKVTNAREK